MFFIIKVGPRIHLSFHVSRIQNFLKQKHIFFFITFRNEDWNVVVAVVVCTTFDFTLLQVPVVKSFNIRSNNRTSCSFICNNKFRRKKRVKYINELYVSLKE